MSLGKFFLSLALLLVLGTGAVLFYSYGRDGGMKNTGQAGKNSNYVVENSKQQNKDSKKENFLLIPARKPDSVSDIGGEVSQIMNKGLGLLNELKDNLELKDYGEKKETPVPTISDTEVFNKLWPQEYRLSLRPIEDQMVKEGFITEEKKNPMADDKNMFAFYRTMLDYAKSKGWVKEDRYQSLRHGIDEVFPSIIRQERANLKRTGVTGEVLPKDQKLSAKKPFSQTANDILDGLRYVFSFAEPANAAWFRDVDCYKDDNPLYPIPGPNLWAFCCNCGMLCTYYCVFLEDCGPEGAYCNRPLGCLNLACRAWPNAIWDPLTGVCGCG